MEIVGEIKKLHFPSEEVVGVGSHALAASGIVLPRELSDVDLVVTPRVFQSLRVEQGWATGLHANGELYKRNYPFDVSMSWTMGNIQQPVEELLTDAVEVDGVYFASPDRVRQWKLFRGSLKDILDISSIDAHIDELAYQS